MPETRTSEIGGKTVNIDESSSAAEGNQPQRYSPAEIEPKWQARWDADPSLYAAEGHDSGKPKYYCLEMLPYPSGALHIGHVRNYAIGDALARHMWMRGYNVLHPMGWDAFGLPAENAALKNGVPPREWTFANIAAMKKQFQRLGMGFDWSTEVTTCLPDYYKWNQWFFLKMFEKGLAYRKKSKVNWCPDCQTVLANEQVIGGRCWRHEDTVVELRDLTQWFLRITKYADELLDGLDKLEGWPEKVRTMQRNWIGRSEGAHVDFAVADGDAKITVFTTRVDTIFGATSVQLAPEHAVSKAFALEDDALRVQIEELLDQQQKARETDALGAIEKHGVFTGRFAVNPFNGERVPIWVANYILADYGTGAIMSVPAHDERDFEFAQKYGLAVRRVIAPVVDTKGAAGADTNDPALPYTGEDEAVLIDSGQWTGENCLEAQEKMAAFAKTKGFGTPTVTYRLKDWGVSRQRYWGTPIPMVYCDKCSPDEPLPVAENELPIVLPEQVDITQTNGSPLGRIAEFVNAKCPKCGGVARRETDTMDTFVDSSWYFYRYTDAKNSAAPFDSDKANYWFPIDQYIGGVEHAILHLIYSRFWTKVMRDLGLVKNDEPAERLFTQGMVIKDGAKMSKSRGNVVSPDLMIERYGSDATRMYALFAAPPDRDLEWQEEGVAGISRFLGKVYRLTTKFSSVARTNGAATRPKDQALLRRLHQTIAKVTQDFDGRWHFNTSISSIMILVNEITANEAAMDAGEISPAAVSEVLRGLILLLAPFAPFFVAEMWEELGGEGVVFRTQWPVVNEELAREDEIEIPVQVNGKLVSVVKVPAGSDDAVVKAAALADPKVIARIEGKTLVKVIVVPGKLVNLVVK
ncbi:leucine--tRNA ligase [Tunturiibacter gelidiferens]|uniref:Leucine--tRNA ligase n=1 Tax=Tunturiibacter gelidiferens TaxID=3069689 RepID=A0AAU7Z0H4_9BACT